MIGSIPSLNREENIFRKDKFLAPNPKYNKQKFNILTHWAVIFPFNYICSPHHSSLLETENNLLEKMYKAQRDKDICSKLHRWKEKEPGLSSPSL